MINLLFIFNSILLGVGLAMDAFSVSMANGLNEPHMSRKKQTLIAGTFAAFQFAMPMIGWICVHTIVRYFSAFQKFVPWIALILLLYIGIQMLIEGMHNRTGKDAEEETHLGKGTLLIQGIATSIDALSVGFTIAAYDMVLALTASLIIAVVTWIICMGGVAIGKKFGMKLAGRASIFGGLILIAIGIEIFVTSH